MERIYSAIIEEHFKQDSQMLFFIGPRQAGKTTVSVMAQEFTKRFTYLNWDNINHRAIIVKGPEGVSDYAGLNKISEKMPVIVFDELHKYGKWKTFLKGFFDMYKGKVHIIVTGSSRLDVYRKGGDSLMGRYFSYRLHPLSWAELQRTKLSEHEIQKPDRKNQSFKQLMEYGGFPEPFLKHNKRFSNRWRILRQHQLFREDLRDLSRIQELGQIELLAELFKHQSAQLTNYTALASKVGVSVDTIRRWIKTLQSFFFCFTIQPWSKNVPRSLLKDPKVYLWDWTSVVEEGGRYENFIACHLLKAVHFWTDRGMGEYDLWFVRDKEKREVDFLVTRDKIPWFLVEVKSSSNVSISKHLYYFQEKLKAPHAFQIAFDMDYVAKDCFSYSTPVIVPAQTFLSQLV